MSKMITIKEATVLLEKYYEGYTSAEEENLLCTFLSQKNLPEQFEADKAILGFFASKRKKRALLKIHSKRHCEGDSPKQSIKYQPYGLLHSVRNDEITEFLEVPKSKIQIIPFLRWTGIAASLIIGITVIHFLMPNVSNSYAYIDGKKVTNIEQIKEQAFASILSWNNSDNTLNLNMDELIIQQLQQFNK